MTALAFTDVELLAWLDEQLPVDRMAEIERTLRGDSALQRHVASLARRRDQGEHSVGQIWRRLRLSCPSRSDLGSFLLETLEPGHVEYVEFHLRTIGCRLCLADLDDLRQSLQSSPDREVRRNRFFESSAGRLRRIDE